MKKPIKTSILSILTFLLILQTVTILFPTNIYASNKTDLIDTSAIRHEISIDAIEYARTAAKEHISTFLELSSKGYSECDENQSFSLGEGFYTYTLYNEALILNDVINFPIIQNGKVVLLLHIMNSEGHWTSNASYTYVDKLTQYTENGTPTLIVYADSVGYMVEQGEVIEIERNLPLTNQKSVNLDENILKNILTNLATPLRMKAIQNSTYDLGYIKNPTKTAGIQTFAAVSGFSTYTDTYKCLNINYCSTDQNDSNGIQNGLCWAASADLIIRYRTGAYESRGPYRSLKPWEIADHMGISYDTGGDGLDIYYAMDYYLNAAELDQYNPYSTSASMTQIHKNINNRFPISMQFGYHDFLIFGWHGHQVTLIGYNNNTLIYFNSGTCKVETTTYNGSGTSIQYNGGNSWRWTASVMIW